VENESEMGVPRVVLPPAPDRGLPPTVPEAEFLAVAEKLTGMLYSRFGKVHGDRDDFHQQVCVWCLEAAGRYDPALGPLSAYLHRHVRNRCLNALRDRVQRADPPCRTCHAGAPCGAAGQLCKRYAAWRKRNDLKANLFRPRSMGDHPDRGEGLAGYTPDVEGGVLDADLMRFIDERLPAGVRGDYLRLMAGESATPSRKAAVRRAVAAILSEAGLPVPGEEFTDEDVERCRPSAGDGSAWWEELPPADGADEQERSGDERPPPLGTESVPSDTIPESLTDRSELSSSAA
jgi:hypothetical protein